MSTCAVDLSCRGITKRFGQRTAVNNVSLDVSPGEVVGVVGANGAGKSTTMRMLVGLTHPTSGQVSVLGESPDDPRIRARMGYLPGDVIMPKGFSGQELVSYYGALNGFGTSGQQQYFQRVNDLAQTFGVDLSRPVHTLSKGNRQKVGLIQAFAHDPEVLVLDEPTSGLDPLMQHLFMEEVKKRARGGAAVFLSSHVLSEIHACAHRVVVMRQGRLIAESTVQDLLAKSALHVEARISSLAMPEMGPLRGLGLDIDYREDGQCLVHGRIAQGDEEKLVYALQHAGRILQLHIIPEDIENTVLTLYSQAEDSDAC